MYKGPPSRLLAAPGRCICQMYPPGLVGPQNFDQSLGKKPHTLTAKQRVPVCEPMKVINHRSFFGRNLQEQAFLTSASGISPAQVRRT